MRIPHIPHTSLLILNIIFDQYLLALLILQHVLCGFGAFMQLTLFLLVDFEYVFELL